MTLRLPWVSRAEYEQQRNWFLRERDDHAEAQKGFCERADAMQARAIRAEELLDAIRAERIAEREAADRRYAELLGRYHDLAAPKSDLVAVGPVIHRAPDEVSKVIREQAEGNVALANHLRRFARKLKDEGKSPDEIIGKLVAWTTTEPAEAAS